jgi:hypothetical protein
VIGGEDEVVDPSSNARGPATAGHGRWQLLAAFVLVAGIAFGMALPEVLASWVMTPDALGYVGTAYNLITGRGFVDPIVYSNYLPDLHPPAPALVIRPPVLSLLLAPPIAMGASLTGVAITHAAWAGLIGASAILAVRRAMSLPSAIAFGIAISWAPGWTNVSKLPLTEVTCVGVLLLALAQCRRVHRSYRNAIAFAAITLLAWLTRPNLGILAPAVVLAAVLNLGPRRALRCAPLWVYVATFALLHWLVVMIHSAVFGLAPYAHYSVMLEILDTRDLASYHREYGGAVAFMQSHGDEILRAIRANLLSYWETVFAQPFYLHVGWISIPGLVYVLLWRGRASFERCFAAIAGIALTATALAVYGGYSWWRYPLPGVVCFWMVSLSLLDDLAQRAQRSLQERGLSRRLISGIGAVPLILVATLWAVEVLPKSMAINQKHLEAYRDHGTRREYRDSDKTLRGMCSKIDADAIVASPDPWAIYLWCGNAGHLLPRDIESVEWAERWLEHKKPAFVITDATRAFAIFGKTHRLQRVSWMAGVTLYRVVDASPESSPWKAPAPISSLGES